MKKVVSHEGHGMTRVRGIGFVRVDLAQAAAAVLDPFPKVVVYGILKRLQGDDVHSPAM
jgi:hypothetical protein